jgi:hypothetical protein
VKRSFDSSIEGEELRESELLLGSIVMEKDLNFDLTKSTLSVAMTASKAPSMSIDFLTEPSKIPNFRKKSADVSEISEFKL